MKKQLVIGDIASRAWDLAVKHWPIFVLFAFITSLCSNLGVNVDESLIANLGQHPDPKTIFETFVKAYDINWPLYLLSLLLYTYLGYVCVNLYVNAHQTGKPYSSLGAIFKADISSLATYIAVNIVVGLFVCIGVCCCILPGIWIGVRLWYAPMLAATQGASFGEAFSRSWDMTRGHFWKLLLMGLTMIGIDILGLCACCIGALFTNVIVSFMLVVSFFILKEDDQIEDAEVIKDEDWNYNKE